ncbi:MAG TPA: hypothetical protein VE548_01335, partial [Nitrososphaeraceae archaeon]|nr:hypothetical protein [Nitrososphaeraceae archaeon]
ELMKIHNTIVMFSMLSTISAFVGIPSLMTAVFAQQGETGTNLNHLNSLQFNMLNQAPYQILVLHRIHCT